MSYDPIDSFKEFVRGHSDQFEILLPQGVRFRCNRPSLGITIKVDKDNVLIDKSFNQYTTKEEWLKDVCDLIATINNKGAELGRCSFDIWLSGLVSIGNRSGLPYLMEVYRSIGIA